VVTGYRLDGDRLVRHRWALVALDGRWLAVDPTLGELPAAPGHLALAAHGGSAAELTVVDETAFAGLARARAMLR
jgi:transglutaminase-like putative cysteine protease